MSGGYPYNTAQWKRLRLAHLSRFPLCMDCRERSMIVVATVVDHIIPISAGGPAYPGHDGLRSCCPSCHSRKTARGVEAGAVRTTRKAGPRKGCDSAGGSLDPTHPWNAVGPVRGLPDGPEGNKSLRADVLNTAPPANLELVPNRDDSWV